MWLTDAKLSERARQLAAADTSQDQIFENLDINDEDDSKWPHNLHVSGADVPHLKKVYSNLRQQLKREPEDKMENLNVNTMMWRTFYVGHPATRSSSWQ